MNRGKYSEKITKIKLDDPDYRLGMNDVASFLDNMIKLGYKNMGDLIDAFQNQKLDIEHARTAIDSGVDGNILPPHILLIIYDKYTENLSKTYVKELTLQIANCATSLATTAFQMNFLEKTKYGDEITEIIEKMKKIIQKSPDQWFELDIES